MINAEEHFYDEDPNKGHPDVRTRLEGVSYFFLGNGKIQAVVQICPEGKGTPVGLFFLNPEKLGKKRNSILFDHDSGLEYSMIRITSDGQEYIPPWETVDASWCFDCKYPKVRVSWETPAFKLSEWFYCRNETDYQLVRRIEIVSKSIRQVNAYCHTGPPEMTKERNIILNPGESTDWFLLYEIKLGENPVISQSVESEINESQEYWKDKVSIQFHSQIPDELFKASCFQMPAVISENAVMDASIWQYNREWVRDHSMMVLGLTFSGHSGIAKKLLERLLNDFVGEDGDPVDSSLTRSYDEVELDQNGELLYALEQYYLWTGDKKIIRDYWSKIISVAEFPLKQDFCHPESGLLSTTREYWERHRLHGILPGIELTPQLFVSIGLNSVSNLAGIINMKDKETYWKRESERIRNALLDKDGFGLIHEGKLIKRRSNDGSLQESIVPLNEAGLPQEVPLARKGDHFLNPDSSTALPIVYGLIQEDSPIALSTMRDLEQLWNQDWSDGGYGRYHVSSEPDSPGSWPFPSLFIARAYAEMKQYDQVWRILNWLYTLPGGRAGTWFEYYGERISPPFPQVGIPPWTWAEMISLFVYHILGLRPEHNQIRLTPKLLTGMERIEASFPFRGRKLYLQIVEEKIAVPEFKSNVKIIESSKANALFAIEDRDIYIEVKI